MMEVFSGRPGDKRIDKEERTYDFLEKCGVEFSRCDHEAAHTIELCRPVEQALGGSICKNLFLTNRQHTEYYLLCMPGDKPFKTKELSSQLGTARLSFAAGEEMEEKLDITPGSLSIFGLLFDGGKRVHLIIDEDLKKKEFFCCHPCINTSSLKIRTADVLEKLVPAMGYEPVFVRLTGE